MGVGEAMGRAVGGILAPLAAGASLVRGAAVFHPDGVVYEGDARSAAEGELADLGRALEGVVLVRFSAALWHYHEGRDPRDVFGAAVRFHPDDARRSQDLLFATFRQVWQLPLAPWLTNPHDVLANEFYAVLPFHVRGAPTTFDFRLVPRAPVVMDGRDYRERLDLAVATGQVVLTLEARPREQVAAYAPVVAITLRERLPIADGALHFNPFRSGAGIVPAGFFQAMRAAAYPGSQLGRRVARGPEE